MRTQIPEKEVIKRRFLADFMLCYPFEFLKYMKPLDFQVWCMMLPPQRLLVWSGTREFKALSKRVYNRFFLVEIWDWLVRWWHYPEIL